MTNSSCQTLLESVSCFERPSASDSAWWCQLKSYSSQDDPQPVTEPSSFYPAQYSSGRKSFAPESPFVSFIMCLFWSDTLPPLCFPMPVTFCMPILGNVPRQPKTIIYNTLKDIFIYGLEIYQHQTILKNPTQMLSFIKWGMFNVTRCHIPWVSSKRGAGRPMIKGVLYQREKGN